MKLYLLLIGTTIIVEKAFSSVLLGEFKESHCHYCLQWTVAPIPCENCSQVISIEWLKVVL